MVDDVYSNTQSDNRSTALCLAVVLYLMLIFASLKNALLSSVENAIEAFVALVKKSGIQVSMCIGNTYFVFTLFE